MLLCGLFCGVSLARPTEVVLPVAPSTLHPLYPWSPTDKYVHDLVHARLFDRTATGYESKLVESHRIEGSTVHLELSKRKWHDGQKFSAADVCATVERVRAVDRPTPFTQSASLRIAGCIADRTRTVRIIAKEGVTDPLSALTLPIVPAHRPEWAGAGPTSTLEPIGLGPYSIFRNEGGFRLRGHWKGTLGKVDLVVALDPAARMGLGQAAAAPFLAPDQLASARGMPDVTLEVVPAKLVWALLVNPNRGPLADVRARNALDLLLDRDTLAATVLGIDHELDRGLWTSVSGPFLPRDPRASSGIPVVLRNPESANIGLLEAGLIQREDGWGWQGQPWTLRVATPADRGPDAAKLKAGLEAQLTGIAVEVVPQTAAQWWMSVLAGGHKDATDLVLVALDPERLGETFHSRVGTEGLENPFHFADAEVDRLLSLPLDATTGQALHVRLVDQHAALFLWAVEGRSARREGAVLP